MGQRNRYYAPLSRKRKARKALIVCYETEASKQFVRKNNLDDALDLDRFSHRSFRSYAELFGIEREVVAERKAKKLVRRMLSLMVDDLLDNDIFVFPEREFGYLKIGNIRTFCDKEEYFWDVRYDGALYGGIFVLDKLLRRSIGGRRYNFQLTQRNIKRLRELRDAGKRYA